MADKFSHFGHLDTTNKILLKVINECGSSFHFVKLGTLLNKKCKLYSIPPSYRLPTIQEYQENVKTQEIISLEIT